jgi:hypothetical protein
VASQQTTGLRAGGPGCLVTTASLLATLVLAPAAAAVRWWRAVRRGREVRAGWEQRSLRLADGGLRPCFELRLDAPLEAETEVVRRLTGTLVRLAEGLRRADDVYHQVVRPAGEGETLLRPVGVRVQSLGERFHLGVGRRPLALRTQLWLALPAGVALAEVVDPFRDDPDASGQPEGLLADPRLRWGVASAFAPAGPSVRYRLLIVVPAAADRVVAGLVEGCVEAARQWGRE